MADGLSVLLALAARWDLAAQARWAPRRRARGRWEASPTQGRHPREPIGQDHGNRGGRGYDAGKQVNGRTRPILVDILGRLLVVVVTGATMQNRDGAKSLLAVLRHQCSRLRHLGADGASAGPLADWVRALRPPRPLRLEMTTRADRLKGVVVIPTRWMVERTLGWLKRDRRLSQDDEYHTETNETMSQGTMIHGLVRRLARIVPY